MTSSCGCCEGTSALTPAAIANPAGLGRLAYRVGTHGGFLATMLARLSSHEFPAPGGRPLRALTARRGDDPAVALLDAWATVADVLSFYTERIANEGYLGTATERRSLLELARLVGYRLRPGVAASVLLAYTLDKDPAGGDTTATIPRGARAQSVPGPGELPQTFETSEELLARASWNVLRPQQTQPTAMDSATADALGTVYLAGITTGLRPNDRMLAVFAPATGGQAADPVVLRVLKATPEPAEDRTRVELLPAQMVAFAATLERLSARLAAHRDLDRAGVARGRIAERIDSLTLAPLERAAGAGPEPHRLQAELAGALPGLREELAEVRRRRFGNLTTWLEGVVADMEHAELAARRAALVAPGNGGATLAPAGGPLDVLDDLRGPLVRPGSRPPADPADLERSPQELFAAGSDVGPQLLVALNPPLASVLYTAWANAPVAEPSPLESLQALRVRAAPFGATAQPKAVLAANGVPVDTEEWPLEGATRLRLVVEVTYGSGPGGNLVPVSVRLDLVTDTGSVGATTSLNGTSKTVTLPTGTISIADSRPAGAAPSLTFQLSGPATRTITVVGPQPIIINIAGTVTVGTGPVAVTVDADPSQVLKPDIGQRLRRTFGNRRVTVEAAERTGTFNLGPVTVTDDGYGAPTQRNVLPLDAVYDGIVPDTAVVIERAGGRILRRATKVETVAKAAYGMTGKVTQLTLSGDWLTASDVFLSAIRETVVHAQTDEVTLAREPRTDDVAGDEITLDALYDGLQTGRILIVSGERTDVSGATGIRASEPVMLAGVVQQASPGDSVRTTLELAEPLAYTYRRDSVEIFGNVAKATHGEGGQEVLGSGDGAAALQSFTLRRSPLTYVAAANPRGVEGALEVFVDEVRWHEADSLAFLGPGDHGYITTTDDADKTTVTFGNGVNGARPPTGEENVTASYRVGIGAAGNVGAGRITQLQTRPLGAGGVTNPLPASGGADRDGVEQARRNVPLGMLALDRLVSVADYEDFARARAGIGKASARRLSDTTATVVHVTVAGGDASRLEASSELVGNLRLALHDFGDPALPVRVAVRELVLLVIAAGVRVHPDHQWPVVERQVRAALLDRFAYERRDLGQDVLLGEVLGTIQAVAGVDWARVEAMTTVPEDVDAAGLASLAAKLATPPPPRIPLHLARLDTSVDPPVVRPAQLAVVSAKVRETLILNQR
jgi:predicted phage baseplate assembly protein